MELTPVSTLYMLPTEGISPAYHCDIHLFNQFAAGRTVTGELILAYFQEVLPRYRPATLARKKAAIKAAVTAALGAGATIGERLQLEIFFKRIKAGTPPQHIITEKTLSEAEIRSLLAHAGEKTSLIIRALYQTGCRISELVAIRLEDCRDTDRGVVIRVLGKRRKERFVYMKTATYQSICTTYKGKTYLFESQGKSLSRYTAHTLIKRAGKKIGRGDLHCHILRHSLATNRLGTMTIDSLANYLGHASPAITARFYCHNAPKMENILGDI